ncbi:unnamed protein product, partial [Prunus brigantina]
MKNRKVGVPMTASASEIMRLKTYSSFVMTYQGSESLEDEASADEVPAIALATRPRRLVSTEECFTFFRECRHRPRIIWLRSLFSNTLYISFVVRGVVSADDDTQVLPPGSLAPLSVTGLNPRLRVESSPEIEEAVLVVPEDVPQRPGKEKVSSPFVSEMPIKLEDGVDLPPYESHSSPDVAAAGVL